MESLKHEILFAAALPRYRNFTTQYHSH